MPTKNKLARKDKYFEDNFIPNRLLKVLKISLKPCPKCSKNRGRVEFDIYPSFIGDGSVYFSYKSYRVSCTWCKTTSYSLGEEYVSPKKASQYWNNMLRQKHRDSNGGTPIINQTKVAGTQEEKR